MEVKEIEYLDRVIRESPELLCFRFTDDKDELPLKEYEKLLKRNVKSVSYASTPFGIYAFPYKYFFKEPPKSLDEFLDTMSREGVEVLDTGHLSSVEGEDEETLTPKRLLLISKGGVLYHERARYIKFIKIRPSSRVWILGENDPDLDYKSALSFSLEVLKSYLTGVDSRKSKALEYFVSLVFSRDRGYFPLFLLSTADKILFTSLADVYDEAAFCYNRHFFPVEEILFGMMSGDKKWIKEMSKVVYMLLSSGLARAIDKRFFEATRRLEIEYENGEVYIDLPMITTFFSLGARLQAVFTRRDFSSIDEGTLIKYLCHHGGLENLCKLFYPRSYEKVRGYLKGADTWSDDRYEVVRDRLAYAASKYFSLSLFSAMQKVSKDFREEVNKLLPSESTSSSGYSRDAYEKIVDSVNGVIWSFYRLFLFFESFANPVHAFPVVFYGKYFDTFFEKGYIFSKMYSISSNRKKIMELYRTVVDLEKEGSFGRYFEEFDRIVKNVERRYSGVSRLVFSKYFFSDDLVVNKKSNYKKTRYLSKYIQSLGFDVVIDPGYGMIHPNEPIQMVILNDEVVEKSVVLENIYYPYFEALKSLRRTVKRLMNILGVSKPTENLSESDLYRLVYWLLKEEILVKENRLRYLGLHSKHERERIVKALKLLAQDIKTMDRVRSKLGLEGEQGSKLVPLLIKAIEDLSSDLPKG